jgi:hypothetical protein
MHFNKKTSMKINFDLINQSILELLMEVKLYL